MTRLSDETLMAYADDALAGRERRAVASVLASDPEAQRIVSMFRLTRELVQHAFSEPMWRLVPEQILAVFERPLKRATEKFSVKPWQIPPMAHAIGFGGGLMAAGMAWFLTASSIPRVDDVGLGEPPPQSALARVLNSMESGTTVVRAAPGGRYALVASMTDRYERSCVEVDVYTTDASPAPATVLVACRTPEARWNVVGAVRTARSGGEAYARDDEAAHSALRGVLSMIGARQRATALPPENQTR